MFLIGWSELLNRIGWTPDMLIVTGFVFLQVRKFFRITVVSIVMDDMLVERDFRGAAI